MAFNLFKRCSLLVLLIAGQVIVLYGQNLVPNWSFEQYDDCPDGAGSGGNLPAIPWISPGTGTADYYNECASGFADVPDNGFGFQYAYTGIAYSGIWCRIDGFEDYREYVQVQLATPLIVGNMYHVSFYINLSNETCGISNVGAYFSVLPPPVSDYFPIAVTPQIANSSGFISDTLAWTLVVGCFVPTEPMRYITIGNFYNDGLTPVDSLCELNTLHSYFYIDDVTVIQVPPGGVEQLELGPPVTACQSYTIESGISNVLYQWSTGAQQPSINVSTSGTYYLTVTGGCTVQVDSVQVDIVDYPSFDIGVDEITVCEGDTFFVSLDPAAGTYTWSDGFMGPEYTIISVGNYAVTLDNGCLVEDELIATFVNVPEPPLLGPDTFLCPNDNLFISLDPLLGEFLWQDNSTSAQYEILTPGTYALTITNICGTANDDINISAGEEPNLVLDSNDIQICDGSTFTLNLDPDAGDYLWEDGSTSSSYEFSIPGLFTVALSNGCGTDMEAIDVSLIHQPVFSLGDDFILCPHQFPYILDPGEIPNVVTYVWGGGSDEQEVTIPTSGVYSLTVSNNCFSASDEIEIFMGENPPDFQLPNDTVLCDGDTLLLSPIGISGNYLWQDSSMSSSYLVDSPGNYSLVVSNMCGYDVDTVLVSLAPDLQEPDFGPDVSLCPGETLVLDADHQIGNYLWQDLSTADTFLVNTSGTYFVSVNNACNSIADTINVTANDNPPQVDLPDQLSLCQGQSITLDAGIGGVAYLWNDNSQNQQLSVSSPGTYSLTVSNSCGTDQDTVFILDGGPAPSVALGNNLQICPGDHVLLSPAFSNVDTWLWHDGSASSTFDISAAGLISVTVSNTCGVSYDTLLVNLLPATPPLDLGPDTSLCSWQSITLYILTPGVSILWPDGSTNPDYTVSGPGNVEASISNSCGTSYDTLVVSALPDIPSLDLGPDQSLCPGEIINVSPGIDNVNYLWQNGSTINSYQSTQQESIILTISNDCGTATDTLEIIESTQGPQVNLGADIQECEGAVVTIPSGISGVNYLWQDGSSNPEFTTNASGIFILQVSNNCGSDIDTINVDISGVPPTVALGPDTTLCEGSTLLLISNADAITSIEWQDGSSSPSFTVSSPGTFTLAESNRCGDDADTIMVSYLDKPDPFTLGSDTTLCPGESVTLNAPSTAYDIQWQDGSNALSIIADQPATYSLQLSNVCGSVSDNLVISFDTRVPSVDLGSDLSWCEGDVFTLDASQPFLADYLWSNGSTSPSIDIATPGVYSIEVSTPCRTTSGDIEVVPGTDCETPEIYRDIFIPNVFSPNGDGINDEFSVSFGQDLDVIGMNGSVYDRWGNLVFSSDVIPFFWDGRFNNADAMPGVYVYTLKVTYLDQGTEREVLFAGDVTLVR